MPNPITTGVIAILLLVLANLTDSEFFKTTGILASLFAFGQYLWPLIKAFDKKLKEFSRSYL